MRSFAILISKMSMNLLKAYRPLRELRERKARTARTERVTMEAKLMPAMSA